MSAMATIEASDLTPLAKYAGETGFKLRSVRHWVDDNVDGFRTACAIRIGKLWFVDRAAATAWLENIRRSGV